MIRIRIRVEPDTDLAGYPTIGYPANNFAGKFIESVWEEYQVVKRERKYRGCGEEYSVEKEAGSSSL